MQREQICPKCKAVIFDDHGAGALNCTACGAAWADDATGPPDVVISIRDLEVYYPIGADPKFTRRYRDLLVGFALMGAGILALYAAVGYFLAEGSLSTFLKTAVPTALAAIAAGMVILACLKLFIGLTHKRMVMAVDGVSLDIKRGETLGLVGESGCGKSTLGRAILRLTEPTGGKVFFDGTDLGRLSPRAMRARRKELQMIFQDPYSSLDPKMTVGQIISEPIRTFGLADRRSAAPHVDQIMETVGLSPRFFQRYPYEFSGGQRQRIGIARSLAVDPQVIIADEPISALDVSIQAQIMNLLKRLQAEKQLTYLFISHDLRAVRHLSDRIAVMYLGKIVELATASDVYSDALMPYTKALISALPVPDPTIEASRERIVLKGDVPSPITPPAGCPFHTRCPYAIAECRTSSPALAEIRPGHLAACLRIDPLRPHIEENEAKGLGAIGAIKR